MVTLVFYHVCSCTQKLKLSKLVFLCVWCTTFSIWKLLQLISVYVWYLLLNWTLFHLFTVTIQFWKTNWQKLSAPHYSFPSHGCARVEFLQRTWSLRHSRREAYSSNVASSSTLLLLYSAPTHKYFLLCFISVQYVGEAVTCRLWPDLST